MKLTFLSLLLPCVPLLAMSGCVRDVSPVQVSTPDASLAVAWNQRVLANAQAADGFLTLKGVRTAAMMHLAMHDALNAIDRRYAGYAFNGSDAGASPIAAASQAAYEVALHEYPNRKGDWDAQLASWRASMHDGVATTRGVALGKQASAAILARRAGDGWDRAASYRFHPMGPGVYAEFHEHSGTPQGFVFGAGWATVTPFVLTRAEQFRSGPPPAIGSREYVRAFDEVKDVGRFESRTRTADQTHLALWWKDFAENSHNRLTRQLVVANRSDLWSAARTFALVNVSIMDGYIAVFDAKFAYNHWRPFTAIRWAAHDGDPDTLADESWNNTHRHTYAFPSYPSAHGTVCAAAMTVLADAFPTQGRFTMETAEVDSAGPGSPKLRMDPPTRSFASFDAAASECAMSRVYLGIHFRYDSVAGNELGNRVGRYALDTVLTSVR